MRCTRCNLVIGYNLDGAHFENMDESSRPVYVLPGGLLSTADMVEGRQAETPPWAKEE